MASSPRPAETAHPAIPQLVADRFLAALQSLADAGREALARSASPQAPVWQRKVQGFIEARLRSAEAAASQLADGNQTPLLTEALPLRFLARDTDGCSPDFTGEPFAQQWTERRRLVVLAAWQVCQSAGAV